MFRRTELFCNYESLWIYQRYYYSKGKNLTDTGRKNKFRANAHNVGVENNIGKEVSMVQIIQGVVNSQLYEKRLKQFVDKVGVYPVSCEKLAAGRTDREWLDQVIAGGAQIVQLRDKESSDRELLAKARYFREKTSEAGVLFFLNDRLDIALLADVDGMHVGQKDLPPAEIRKLAPDILIGFSCNTEEQTKALGQEVEQNKSAVS